MDVFSNPWRGTGLSADRLPGVPLPADDPALQRALLDRCPVAAVTPLTTVPDVARVCSIATLWVKNERARMGLGSFKALGAAYVIAHLAQEAGGSLPDRTFVTASAGNHGLSVAAGARVFGATSVVYIAETVPESFAARLAEQGAKVVRAGADYAASMAAAEAAAENNGWTLLSDSSWPGNTALPHRLMEGYLALAHEAAEQIPEPPTHIFLQAGVGGMAAAVAAHARRTCGDAPHIAVVEPDLAPALLESARAGRAVVTEGAASCMGRLDCKAPSLIALAGLARDADSFLTLSETEVPSAMVHLADADLATSPSGGAGLAALLTMGAGIRAALAIGSGSRVLCILSEAP